MPLGHDMDINQICEYLDEDLKKSIINDVKPVIQPNQKEGGYFGVTRLVLCYDDYLGSLYVGYHGETDRNGRPIVAKSDYAKRFVKEVFKEVDPIYEKHGDLLYEMYRHGTVHLYQPKTLVNRKTKETLSWVVYKGPRNANLSGFGDVSHMKPKRMTNTAWILPISINCLFDDLIASIDKFKEMLNADSTLVTKWRSTANALIDYEETNLSWDTP